MSAKKPSRRALYDTLGIEPGADDAAIKSAFRQQAKATHPDTGGAAKDFEEVKRAHVVLSDPARRAKYDATGEIDEPIVNQTDALAMALIGEMLIAILGGDEDPMDDPLVEAMKIHIGKLTANLTKQIEVAKRAKRRAEKMHKRFRRKNEGQNVFEKMLAWNVRKSDDEIAGKVDAPARAEAAARTPRNQTRQTRGTAVTRTCGDCQLCCTLLPLRELNKPANTRCPHQRFHKGCQNYARRPTPCKLWSCVWLSGEDTGDMRRPDRVHYVVDILPDFIKVRSNDAGEETPIEVIQVWVDPKHPHAHRDPALRADLEHQARKTGKLALVRCGSEQGIVLVPPCMNKDREWVEVTSAYREKEHSAVEVHATLQAMREAV